jgi:hypothetical protein
LTGHHILTERGRPLALTFRLREMFETLPTAEQQRIVRQLPEMVRRSRRTVEVAMR